MTATAMFASTSVEPAAHSVEASHAAMRGAMRYAFHFQMNANLVRKTCDTNP
jgi:hypothetical protein